MHKTTGTEWTGTRDEKRGWQEIFTWVRRAERTEVSTKGERKHKKGQDEHIYKGQTAHSDCA